MTQAALNDDHWSGVGESANHMRMAVDGNGPGFQPLLFEGSKKGSHAGITLFANILAHNDALFLGVHHDQETSLLVKVSAVE